MTSANCSMENAQVRISTKLQRGVLWACVLVLAVYSVGCIPEPSSEMEIAACNENPEVIRLLIEKGADVNAKGKDGVTPLHFAAWHGNLEVIKLLIEKGADVNAKSNDGTTPLHAAASSANPEVIKLLIEKGAVVEPFDPDKLVADYKKSKEALAKNLAAKKTIQTAIASYEWEIAQLRDDLQKKENLKKSNPPAQPVKRSDWSTLKMGEFEEETDFQKRVESAKQKSETDYAIAMDDWKVNVKSHNDQWEYYYVTTLPSLRKSTTEKIADIEKKVAVERNKLDSIQTVNLNSKVVMFYPYECEQLPTFDRTTMSFPSVKLFPSGNDWNTSSANEYCRVSITGDAYKTQSLYFPTLEKAKAFKEAYERNEVSFLVVAEVQYIESKYDKVITQTAPEKSYSGTFHCYGVEMIGPVLAVDKNGFVDTKSGK